MFDSVLSEIEMSVFDYCLSYVRNDSPDYDAATQNT